jgi:hypothetical protein
MHDANDDAAHQWHEEIRNYETNLISSRKREA